MWHITSIEIKINLAISIVYFYIESVKETNRKTSFYLGINVEYFNQQISLPAFTPVLSRFNSSMAMVVPIFSIFNLFDTRYSSKHALRSCLCYSKTPWAVVYRRIRMPISLLMESVFNNQGSWWNAQGSLIYFLHNTANC